VPPSLTIHLLVDARFPQQGNDYDCGVYLALAVEQLCDRAFAVFKSNDIMTETAQKARLLWTASLQQPGMFMTGALLAFAQSNDDRTLGHAPADHRAAPPSPAVVTPSSDSDSESEWESDHSAVEVVAPWDARAASESGDAIQPIAPTRVASVASIPAAAPQQDDVPAFRMSPVASSVHVHPSLSAYRGGDAAVDAARVQTFESAVAQDANRVASACIIDGDCLHTQLQLPAHASRAAAEMMGDSCGDVVPPVVAAVALALPSRRSICPLPSRRCE
jgi:hypothetical protein